MITMDSYLRDFERTLRLPRAERRAIVAELRSHLVERLDDARRERPGVPEEALVEQVLADLGDPRSLAISYGERETTVRTRRGEQVVSVVRAIGRGTGAFLKWTGIVLAALLVLGLGVAYVAWQEAKPFLEEEHVREVHHFRRDCEVEACHGLPVESTFAVAEGAREVMGHLRVKVPPAGGSVQITVRDPNGRTVFDRSFVGGPQSSLVSEELSWGPTAGTWTITAQFTGFRGEVDLGVAVRGLPQGTL